MYLLGISSPNDKNAESNSITNKVSGVRKTIILPEEINLIEAGDRLLCTDNKRDTIKLEYDKFSYIILAEDDSITLESNGKILKRFSYNSELGHIIIGDNE